MANSADGTVSVFAVVTSGPTFANEVTPGNQDHLIATVPVGKTPQRIAVTQQPNRNRAYVTNQGDNSLWVVDVTNVSQGTVTSQNVNPSNNQLQLFQPGGIAIAAVKQGANTGKSLAFVANQGANTVSVIDTSNNTLFATVSLGAAGSSTTVPEVAATADGTAVFVSNNSTVNCRAASNTACAGVWSINATSVTPGTAATNITNTVANLDVGIATPRGLATLLVSQSGTTHTLLGVTDSGNQGLSGGEAVVFVVDTTVACNPGASPCAGVLILNGASPSTLPSTIAMTALCVPNATPCASGSTLYAEVLDTTNNEIWLFSGTSLTTSPNRNTLVTTITGPTSLAATPDGQFSYLTSGQNSMQLIENLSSGSVSLGFADGANFGNRTTISTAGNSPTGLAISPLDPGSAPVTWFIPQISGGFQAPTNPLTVGASLSVSGESMVGVLGQSVQTMLNFGSGTSCSIFDATKGASGTTCAANATNGANGIGGSTASPPGFPNSGVFVVTLTGTSNGVNGFAKELVSVGANCSWSPPSSVLLNVPVSADLTCTAPGKDTIQGTIDWGDGTKETKSVTALGSTTVSLSFTSHAYSAANSYQVKVTLVDTPPGAAGVPGSVVPSPTTIVAANIILPTAPTIVAPGQSAVVPVSFSGGSANAGVTVSTSCSVSPAGGPVCSVSPATVTLKSDGTGNVVVSVTANGSSAALLVPRGGEWTGLPLALIIVLLGLTLVFFKCSPRNPVCKRPRWGLALLLLTSVIMLATGACTTVQRSNIGCTSCTASGSYMVMFSAKSVTPPLQINGVFTVTVTQ